jgi:hypothetical protein
VNPIFQTLYDFWCKTKTKKSPSGWLDRNCPFCEHRGHSPDRRGRAGLKFDDQTISLNCFNCNFTASFTIGRQIYPKMIKAMKWLGIDEKLIAQLKFEALKLSREFSNQEPKINIVRRNIKEVELPSACSLLQNEISSHPKHIDFLKSRGFDVDDFPFLVSSDLIYKSRVILPFIMHDTMIGYSARSIIPQEKYRYIMKMTTDFVFGMEWVKPEHTWVFVTEGILDALSVKCLAVMHNEISDAQTEMLCDLQKNVIVVPDMDKAGLTTNSNGLINTALDCGWSVAFPEWKQKDINAAYVNYGPLFCIKHLLDVAISNPIRIRLKQKFLNMALKNKIKK